MFKNFLSKYHKSSVPKILIYFFLIIFILQLASLIFLLLIPESGNAADIKFIPQIGIGDDFQKEVPKDIGTIIGGKITSTLLGEYIRAIYKYAIGIVGILAAVVLMFGGVLWLTAGGSAERVGEAKSWIGASLTGLILALCSYMILATINPKLVEFKPLEVRVVDKIITGCCEYSGGCTTNISELNCENKEGYYNWTQGNNFTCKNKECMEIKTACCICQNKNTKKTISCSDDNKNMTLKTECEGHCRQIGTTIGVTYYEGGDFKIAGKCSAVSGENLKCN